MPKFWLSSRFWSLVLIAGVHLLGVYGLLPVEVVEALYVVLGGHVGLRSVDRFAENVGKK